MGRRTTFAAVATLLGCVIISLAPVATAHSPKPPAKRPVPAPAPVTFGIGAASATGLSGQPDLVYQSSPGGNSLNYVAVVNYAATPERINVYTVDATNGANGTVAFAASTAPRTDEAAWLSVVMPHGGDAITLPAHSTKVLAVNLAVPKNATPGDHIAAVIASLTSRARTAKGEKVNLEQRVALRAYLRVSGKIVPGFRVENLQVHYHNAVALGGATMSFTVHNTGNISLGGTVQVQMGGVVGPTATARGAALPLLLPGGTYSERVVLHGIWPVFYDRATVRIHPLAQAGAVDPVLPYFTSSSHLVTIPWLLVGFVVLVAAWLLMRQFVWLPRRERVGPARHQLAGSQA
jgi:hypothetical protein